MRLLTASLVVVALLAPAAHAQEKTAEAKALYLQGQAAYAAGDFTTALQAFEAAHAAAPLPALWFNIAQCHRKLAQHQSAIDAFTSFQREQQKMTPETKAEVERLLAEERQLLADEQAKAAAEAEAAAPEEPPLAQLERAPPPPGEPATPLLESPLFLGGVAAGVVALVGTAVIVALNVWPAPAPPNTTLGTVDLR
ncbi:MAG: hypothetical protein A2138_08080 [Deltaproteobacteria bacterium RBG_16_71_12]|nr:MAG: hypothetical protein A2138_08080 [Deltaproteobacteria bacterium RBG_16_71_12]